MRKKLVAICEDLVGVPSVSPDVSAENALAHRIVEHLEGHDLLIEQWATGDGRHTVAALLCGTHPANTGDTLLLMGHYDTVGTEEYVNLGDETVAHQPERLRTILQIDPATPDAIRAAAMETDDEGYIWQFGRGTLDMKSGVAINIGLMHHFAERRDQLAGNLLFLACPDEEVASLGIRTALAHIQLWEAQHNLTLHGLINTDCTTEFSPDDDGRNAYLGSIGKLLPSAYAVGVSSHVGEPLRGVDANIILAELIRAFHFNSEMTESAEIDLGDGKHTVQTVPPVILKASDLKTRYNTQTAAEANLNLNWLMMDLSAEQVLNLLKSKAQSVLHDLVQQHKRRATAAGVAVNYGDGQVLTFAELMQMAGDDFVAQPTSGDPRAQSLQLVQQLVRHAHITAPCVVLYYAPPYYPAVHPATSLFSDALRTALQQYEDIQLRGYFPLISDMSFIVSPTAENIGAWQQNAPLRDSAEVSGLGNLPVVNIGSWGYDAHGLYERVHIPYTFGIIPNLLLDIISQLFSQ